MILPPVWRRRNDRASDMPQLQSAEFVECPRVLALRPELSYRQAAVARGDYGALAERGLEPDANRPDASRPDVQRKIVS